MVNRIPNGSLLTNKLGLLNSLQEYAKVGTKLLHFFTSLSLLCRISNIWQQYHVEWFVHAAYTLKETLEIRYLFDVIQMLLI